MSDFCGVSYMTASVRRKCWRADATRLTSLNQFTSALREEKLNIKRRKSKIISMRLCLGNWAIFNNSPRANKNHYYCVDKLELYVCVWSSKNHSLVDAVHNVREYSNTHIANDTVPVESSVAVVATWCGNHKKKTINVKNRFEDAPRYKHLRTGVCVWISQYWWTPMNRLLTEHIFFSRKRAMWRIEHAFDWNLRGLGTNQR